ncbi:hypothetical protein amb1559 [Paramagnetospirillum magneticum AMB-1]|uniref:Uncharacterized protein n=1 Tax=Paramagnetospirillum magneticum (strain ATCC 700264 / AMB-1) TaxID=342108 RepID=Q2W712_PARM1|nr:hypothetical protein amb1559 [Paramagnetospirillum magneticum AMB-1]
MQRSVNFSKSIFALIVRAAAEPSLQEATVQASAFSPLDMERFGQAASRLCRPPFPTRPKSTRRLWLTVHSPPPQDKDDMRNIKYDKGQKAAE